MATSVKCRVCICTLEASAGCYDMRKLPKLAHKFETCTDLSVSGEQRVPSELCHTCCDQLERLYAFRARCIASDTKWRMEILAFSDENETVKDVEEVTSVVETIEVPEDHAEEEQHLQDVEPEQEVTVEESNAQPNTSATTQSVVDLNPASTLSTNIYKCDICATQFLEQHRLQAHMRQHGNMPYPCPEPGCDRGYSHKNTLSVHMRKCHKLGKEPKSHVCEYCGKTFDTMWRLKNHRFTHKDKSELPYVCEDAQCGRRFSSKQLLKVHMMRHAGIKNYRCTYCGVQKTTRTELKIHLNYHTLERTYSCRICSKVCNSSSNLNLHMRTVHERSRNYPCTYCDRIFTQPALRKQHELIHTGEKPHECEECGRHFRQKTALRTHRKIHERQSSDAKESNPGATIAAGNLTGNDINEYV